MAFYTKQQIFDSNFKRATNAYDILFSVDERDIWIKKKDNIDNVKVMNPEILALSFAYLKKTVLKDSDNIETESKLDEYIELQYNMDEDNILYIIKQTQSSTNSQLNKWPFEKNPLTKLKLKMQLSAYNQLVLESYFN